MLKKFLRRIKSKLHNEGSGLVLVIVALGFVGVLTGALLTAAAYVYRLKLYDYNARDNFFYLEQAMDEIYAGVGSETVNNLQDAYQDTLENVVYYDPSTMSYENIGNDKANAMFKDNFMNKLKDNPFFNKQSATGTSSNTQKEDTLEYKLAGCISNSTVKLDVSRLNVAYKTTGSDVWSANKPSDQDKLQAISIQNVTLTRTVDYNRSQARGNFTQTISTDIVVSRPDFNVNFDTVSSNINTLFDFCMIADSGVEIDKPDQSLLTINGNIYAASDFYNKKYNNYENRSADDQKNYQEGPAEKVSDPSKKWPMNKVSSYAYTASPNQSVSAANTTLFNHNAFVKAGGELTKTGDTASVKSANYLYDGLNDRSKYSGLYVDNSVVNVLADKLIVPGTVAVMNPNASLTVVGKNGTNVSTGNIWADEIVLGGTSTKDAAGNVTASPQALLNADLYVKDDTSFEADGSKFKLLGSYFGFSNTTTADNRQFVPTTAKNQDGTQFIYQDSTGQNRGHYNSSALVVNGQNTSIDLSATKNIYIAGRAYIELSKKTEVTGSGETQTTAYTYDSTTGDYKTGESVSIKSNQLAYVVKPVTEPTLANPTNSDTNGDGKVDDQDGTYWAELPTALATSTFINKYFGKGNANVYPSGKAPVAVADKPATNVQAIPVKRYDLSEKKDGSKVNYYFDFDYAYQNGLYDKSTDLGDEKTSLTRVTNADDLSADFIRDYFDIVQYSSDYIDLNANQQRTFQAQHSDVDVRMLNYDILDDLKEVTDYEDYVAGQIAAPATVTMNQPTGTGTNSNGTTESEGAYASGGITYSGSQILQANQDVKFDVTTSRDAVSRIFQQSTTSTDGETQSVTDKTFSTADASQVQTNGTTVTGAMDLSNNLQKEYNYLKWTLESKPQGSPEADFVDRLTSTDNGGLASTYGEASITPINYYMNFDKITNTTDIYPGNAADNNDHVLDLGGQYRIWVSNSDVHVKADPNSSVKNTVNGIIITKGDVYFDNVPSTASQKDKDEEVKNFNGIIISGGKIYVNGNQTNINATPLCRQMINACINAASEVTTDSSGNASFTKNAKNAQLVLSLFKNYEGLVNTTPKAETNDMKSITSIDYDDVLRYENWMKNVN